MSGGEVRQVGRSSSQPLTVLQSLTTSSPAPGIIRAEAMVGLSVPLSCQVATELLLNAPVPAAAALPVRAAVSHISCQAAVTADIDVGSRKVTVTLAGPPRLDLALLVEAGTDLALSDSDKLRRLILSLATDALTNRFVAPHSQTFDLDEFS